MPHLAVGSIALLLGKSLPLQMTRRMRPCSLTPPSPNCLAMAWVAQDRRTVMLAAAVCQLPECCAFPPHLWRRKASCLGLWVPRPLPMSALSSQGPGQLLLCLARLGVEQSQCPSPSCSVSVL